eukprot:TRINITY_DN29640_c0_g1_i1.p1 TRINITY_DN29640_c0_g1~~TRINITY_DN29640_c0_g1_i1.p1  ORF type:complete len:129 (+),score=30.24 TRINITY_DN29640_c0_g1_i1:67-453(+)
MTKFSSSIMWLMYARASFCSNSSLRRFLRLLTSSSRPSKVSFWTRLFLKAFATSSLNSEYRDMSTFAVFAFPFLGDRLDGLAVSTCIVSKEEDEEVFLGDLRFVFLDDGASPRRLSSSSSSSSLSSKS